MIIDKITPKSSVKRKKEKRRSVDFREWVHKLPDKLPTTKSVDLTPLLLDTVLPQRRAVTTAVGQKQVYNAE